MRGMVLRLVVRRISIVPTPDSPSHPSAALLALILTPPTRAPSFASLAFLAPLVDIGGSGNVRGIERWTDGLKWGPSRVRDVSHPWLVSHAQTHSHPPLGGLA